jgi:hypothetical protein
VNIFSVLSQGNSSLREVGMSAMLGYLLSPAEDHGLGDTLLRAFLEYLGTTLDDDVDFSFIPTGSRLKTHVELEKRLNTNGSAIDIFMVIFDGDTEVLRIGIENKIKRGAVTEGQLQKYYDLLKAEQENDNETCPLYMIYLTPNRLDCFEKEYCSLEVAGNDKKAWLQWSQTEKDDVCVMTILRGLLQSELLAEIPPINEYMRHTLKAFIQHLVTYSLSTKSRKGRTDDTTDIIETRVVEFDNGEQYEINRRSSSQIQVFRLPRNGSDDDKEQVPAKRVMLNYIEQKALEVGYKPGANTRSIGRNLLKALSEINSAQ